MSPTILVIDDNPKIKDNLDLAFPEYTFLGAGSAEQGLECLRRPNEIDLIILDHKMQGMDGITALKEIRRLEPRIGVMMLTSFGSKDLAVEALRGRADDFIDKPFSVKDIKTKIEAYFDKMDGSKEAALGGDDPVKRVQRFMERNFGKDLTLEEAARKAEMSPKYLSRCFKRQTQMSFSGYKTKLRVEYAKKMLKETSSGIAQIAYRVGYENAESLMKAFKKTCGCTPTQYRSGK